MVVVIGLCGNDGAKGSILPQFLIGSLWQGGFIVGLLGDV